MKFIEKHPPRTFDVGYDKKGIISDCGSMYLQPDEQITLFTELGGEYDVTRKDWGFYATPSLNGRLASFKLKTVLTKNRYDRYFIMLVEEGQEDSFQKYVDQEPLHIVAWLDSNENLQSLDKKLNLF
jgi:hypothetical protein